jgi:acyl-CoA dehydrogenase
MSTDVQQDLLVNTLTRIFGNRAMDDDQFRSDSWDEQTWNALRDSGMAYLGVAEDFGGSGGDVADSCLLLRLAGRSGIALPLAELSLLGGWLIERGNLRVPDGPITVPIPRNGDGIHISKGRINGKLSWVPWGSTVAAIVATAHSDEGEHVVILNPSEATTNRSHNIAGEPRDELIFDNVDTSPDLISQVTTGINQELNIRGALSRTVLMAGAIESTSRLTIEYANRREQFGRPILSFQAIGNRIAQLTSEAELAKIAADVAVMRFSTSGIGADFDVSAARVCVTRAASLIALQAHQIHGAIGMTAEYPLQGFTRRLWAWRQEWGSERTWSESLGLQVQKIGGEELWARITTS